jgi:spore protease
MSIRTDLAIENTKNPLKKEKTGDVTTYFLEENNEKYYTLDFKRIDKMLNFENLENALFSSLDNLLPKSREKILVVGLGNTEITSDSIGPKVCEQILATRHIMGNFAEKIGLKGLKSVSVIAPNVLGKTGIEVSELIGGAVKTVMPDAVIVIDALCSKSTERLFSCIQLCNNGISPGSGVKNARKEISRKSLGIPVVAIGVPTVVDAKTIAFELTGKEAEDENEMIVTPKDADLLCQRISEFLSTALNVFLQPEIDREIILSLV